MVALDVGRPGRGGEPRRGLCLGGAGLAVGVAVVDHDPQPGAELLQAADDAGLVQVVGDDADLCGRVGDRLVEDLEDGTPGLEPHPRERVGRLRVGRDEGEPLVGDVREEGRDRPGGLVPVDEGLRRHKAARIRDVEQPGVGLAAQLQADLLLVTPGDRPRRGHERGPDPIAVLAELLGIEREMDPAELLDRGEERRLRVRSDVRGRRRERDPVPERQEVGVVRRAVLDREPDEVGGWRRVAPIHPEQCHPVAPMHLQREGRVRVRPQDLDLVAHVSSPCETRSSRATVWFRLGRSVDPGWLTA